MYTGTGNFQVPIWNVSSRDISDPVSMVYSVRGVKLNERGGRFGVSWDLNAGGSVSREVRGLPDDFKGIGNDRRRGWFYQKYSTSTYLSSDVASLPNTSDNPSVCTDESSDYNQINGYGYDNDTEPDIFYFNVGSHSGSFVFDNSATSTPVIRLIPHQDIKIVPTFNPADADPKITGFTITTNTGTVYTLNESVWESRFTTKLISETTVEFLKTRYEQYSKLGYHDNKEVGYSTEWKLSKVTSTTSDELIYAYSSEQVTSVDTVRAYIIRNSNTTYYRVDVFSDSRTTTYKYLNHIYVRDTPTTQKKALELITSSGRVSTIKVFDYRRGTAPADFVKQFNFTYNVTSTKTFLSMLSESSGSGGESIPPYVFRYQLEYLPSKYSKDQDYWGYYNAKNNTHLAPKLYVYPGQSAAERFRIEPLPGYTEGVGQYTLAGANRSVDTLAIQYGTLKTIIYPWGGSVDIKYESNEYYDTLANQNFKGGGLRIKSLHYDNGTRSDTKIEKYFTYSDATGKSYGRLISKPNFAMLTWEYRDPFSNTEQVPLMVDLEWYNHDKIIVRLEEDISASVFTGGSAVGYKQVKVKRPGAGYAIHEFELPATFGTSTSGTFWTATQNKYARISVCPAIQWYTGGINGFPFTPNPNFDHERGLPKRKRDFNEGDTLVSEIRTTYQNIYKAGSTPEYVWGLHFEKYPNSDATMFLFGKYFLLTDVARVPASETVISYDMTNPLRSITQSSNYYYESANHKFLSRTRSTTADGTIFQTYVKYPKDYPNTTVYWDEATEAINAFKAAARNGVPIEVYQTITKPGDSEKVLGGSIVKFSDFDIAGKILPESTLSWKSATPVLLTAFTSSWTDELFHADSRYEISNTISSYGLYDVPLSSIGQARVYGSTVYGYNSSAPVVSATGATNSQFAFSDFETSTLVGFTETGNPTYGTGRTGTKSIYFISTSLSNLSRPLSKGADTYILSGWFKHSGAAITYNVKIKNTAGTTTYYNQNLTFTPATPANTFEYFEKEIPIDPSLQTFKIELTPVSGTCYLDDVSFYPAQASLTSYTYTFPFGANSVTSGHVTSFVEFDTLGRTKYVRDKDGNILQKQTTLINTY